MPVSLFGMPLPTTSGQGQWSEPVNPSDPWALFQKGRQEQVAQEQAQVTPSSDASGSGYATLAGNADRKVAQHRAFIEEAAKKWNVPANVIAGVMMVESGGDGRAVGANTKWGNAKGAMQVMPFWFKSGEDPFDLKTNIDRGAQILANNYKKRGNWDQAISDYNGTTGSSKGTYYLNKVMGYVNKWGGMGGSGYRDVGTSGAGSGALVNAVKLAMNQQGKSYVLGAKVDTKNANPSAFDCSSLVQWAYGRNGIALPRLAAQQYNATQRVNKDQLKPGDLVFFSGTTGAPGITHVGIYIGNGQMVNAVSEGKGIQVQNINSNYWSSHYAGGGRVSGDYGTASGIGSGVAAPASAPSWSFGNIFRRA